MEVFRKNSDHLPKDLFIIAHFFACRIFANGMAPSCDVDRDAAKLRFPRPRAKKRGEMRHEGTGCFEVTASKKLQHTASGEVCS